ncbi:MAG TPA: hypothetical protein VKR52_06735 [Terracidiphilus sp.]|nr:hypothetical protein [Terracidiphilus sp.]
MGVWGTGVFSDDTASDLREEYRSLIGDGLDAAAAKARILDAYQSSFADPSESCVAWLALAAVQWKLGRLDPDTLEHAIHVIDSGADLARWDANPKDRARRNTVLEKLRAEITSPQPPAKKVAKQVLSECRWQIGEHFSYRLLSGGLILFRVIGRHTDKGGTYPVCELLDWTGDPVPPEHELRSLTVKASRSQRNHTITKVMLVGFRKKWDKRIQDVGLMLQPAQTAERTSVVHFKFLDNFLKNWFELE